jgi:2-C-methyl-D-erythritol 4-phosphate cytidylyltransferase
VLLRGKPVLIHTLERFQTCDAIDNIVVTVAEDQVETVVDIVTKAGITKLSAVVAGGSFRAASVRNGFEAVQLPTDIVVVHDGVRPLVSAAEIENTIEQANEVGAACLTAPVADTIKSVDNGRIIGTIDRQPLRRALTPQAFKYEILKRALSENILDENVTDECQLVERLGNEIAAVEGDPYNIKITTSGDLAVAEALLRASIG